MAEQYALPPGFSSTPPGAAPSAAGGEQYALPPGFSSAPPGGAQAPAPAQPAHPAPDFGNDTISAAMRSIPGAGPVMAAADALTGGRVTQTVSKIASALGNSALDAVKLPGDVLFGNAGGPEIDPMTGQVNNFPPDMIGRGLNAAGFMLGGETPAGAGRLVTADGMGVPTKVTRAVGRDQVPLDQVGSQVAALGPAGKVADLGTNTQALAAGIATQPGAASTTITNALRARQVDATNRVPAAINDTLGPATPPSEIKAGITANKKEVSPAYQQALAGASPVDTTPIAEALDAQIPGLRGKAQTDLQSVRGMLNDTAEGAAKGALSSDPNVLFQTRQAIDGMLSSETDNNARRVLSDARGQVDEMLAEAAPGIKDADAQYRELSRQSDALDAGGSVLDRKDSAVWPQENAAAVASGVQPEGTLVGPSAATFRLSQGARADIERIVGTKANDRVALAGIIQGEGDWNIQKLGQLFGPDRADRIMQIVNNERRMAETENKALSGSKTAATDAAQADVNAPARGPNPIRQAMNTHVGDALWTVADKLTAGRASAQRTLAHQEIADIIMGNGDWRQAPGAAPVKAPLPIPQRHKQDDQAFKAAIMRGP